MIDDLVEDESRITNSLDSMALGDFERLILQVVFTEESLEDSERVLREHFGVKDAKRSIERALARVRHQGKKRPGR